MEKDSRILVFGASGMAGSAIVRNLRINGYNHIFEQNSSLVDLRKYSSVYDCYTMFKPDYVFFAAARVGGIMANSLYSAEFIYDNICMQNNVIHNAYISKAKKLLFLGSSCVYRSDLDRPINESDFLTGELEDTNKGYAVAKISGITMCQLYNKQYGTNFISCMPTNLMGANDNYHIENSHVAAALIRRFHEAKIRNYDKVIVWGSGNVFREFLHVDDFANAAVFLMQHYNDSEIVNIGTGSDVTINKFSKIIAKIIGYNGVIEFDKSKPDGTKRKRLDVSKINCLGWKSSIPLEDAIRMAYDSFLNGKVRNK